MAGGEVYGGERAVLDGQGEAIAVQDVEHVEYVHGVARPRLRQQLAELRALEGVETAVG